MFLSSSWCHGAIAFFSTALGLRGVELPTPYFSCSLYDCGGASRAGWGKCRYRFEPQTRLFSLLLTCQKRHMVQDTRVVFGNFAYGGTTSLSLVKLDAPEVANRMEIGEHGRRCAILLSSCGSAFVEIVVMMLLVSRNHSNRDDSLYQSIMLGSRRGSCV